jgi:hypothetical protein
MSDKNAKGRKVPASPGFIGAVKDAVAAIADAATPPAIKPRVREQQIRDAEEEAVSGRKKNQSTDHMN